MSEKTEVVTMRYATRLLARASACAKQEGMARAEFIRGAVAAACSRSEAQTARRMRIAKAEAQARGVHSFPGGLRYKGGIRDGLPHGRGVMTFPGGPSYEAEYRKGEPVDGPGVMVDSDGRRTAGVFRGGEFIAEGEGGES